MEVAITIALVSSIAAILAAVSSTWQARTAQLSNESSIFLLFSERYNDQEMAIALRRLAHWYNEQGAGFAEEWEEKRRADDAEALQLNDDRRLVSRFFVDIGRLYGAGLISFPLARAVTAHNGLNVFFIVCEPMNDIRHPERNRRFSKYLRRVRKRYGKGEVYSNGSDEERINSNKSLFKT